MFDLIVPSKYVKRQRLQASKQPFVFLWIYRVFFFCTVTVHCEIVLWGGVQDEKQKWKLERVFLLLKDISPKVSLTPTRMPETGYSVWRGSTSLLEKLAGGWNNSRHVGWFPDHLCFSEGGGTVFTLSSFEKGKMGLGGHTQEHMKQKIRLALVQFHCLEEFRSIMNDWIFSPCLMQIVNLLCLSLLSRVYMVAILKVGFV